MLEVVLERAMYVHLDMTGIRTGRMDIRWDGLGMGRMKRRVRF